MYQKSCLRAPVTLWGRQNSGMRGLGKCMASFRAACGSMTKPDEARRSPNMTLGLAVVVGLGYQHISKPLRKWTRSSLRVLVRIKGSSILFIMMCAIRA